MANPKLTLVTDNTKVNLGGQVTHTVFSNPPQVITIAQPDLSACVPKRAEGLFGARTSQDLVVELGKLLAEIEMDTFVIGMYIKDDKDPAESPSALVMGQCRNDWIQRYDQEGFIDIDPRFAHCLNNTSPYVWDRTQFEGQAASPLFEEAAKYGLRAGISAPLLTHQGYLGMFSASTSLSLYRDDLFSPIIRGRFLILKDYLTELLTAENRSMVAAGQEREATPSYSLSRREREVLYLVASGYSTDRIADKLRLSNSTVSAHIANIKRCLGVQTQSHATARAIKHKLIPLPD